MRDAEKRLRRLEAMRHDDRGLDLLVRAMRATYADDTAALATIRSELAELPAAAPSDGQLLEYARAIVAETPDESAEQ